MVQQNPLDSLFGSVGTNAMTGMGGLGAGLQSANSGNDNKYGTSAPLGCTQVERMQGRTGILPSTALQLDLAAYRRQ